MKKITKFLMTVIVLCTTMGMSVTAQNYFTDYGAYNNAHSRKLNSLTFSKGTTEVLNLSINQETVRGTSPVYFDKTENKIEVLRGEELSIRFDFTGVWMHNIAYVDWNKDMSFSTDGDTERVGYNVKQAADQMTKAIIFTVPTSITPGEYRMRIMVDWIEPTLSDEAKQSSPNAASLESINKNGGSVTDVILKVIEASPIQAPTFSSMESNLLMGDNTIIITSETGTTIKYTTDGSEPSATNGMTSTSNTANVEITGDAPVTIKALTVKGTDYSNVKSMTYKLVPITLDEYRCFIFSRTQETDGSKLALTEQGDNNNLQTTKFDLTSETQLWKFEKGTQQGLYKLVSKNGNQAVYFDTNRFKSSTTETPAEFKVLISGNTQHPGYELQRNGSDKAMNVNGGSKAGNEITEWNIGDAGNTFFFVTREVILKAQLKQLLDLSNSLYTLAKPADQFGGYTDADKATLKTAIDNAQNAYDNSTVTVEELNTQITTLTAAIEAFKVTQNKNLKSLVSSMANTNRWFTIRSASTIAYATNKVISSNGRNVGDKFTFEDKATTPTDEQLFKFVLSADGSSVANIINKAGNTYMAQNGMIVATPAENTGTFTITEIGDGLSFKITASEGAEYLKDIHAQASGTHIVNWDGGIGSASAWILDFVKDESTTGLTNNSSESNLNISVNNGKVSISGVETFEVYTISGQQVNANQRLEKGVYLIKANNFIQKVIVK